MSDGTYDLIKKELDVSALRQRVIANNIANLNTKGFKRSEVVFEDKLQDALSGNGQNDGINSVQPKVVKDNSTSFREDGNNIDIDKEMTDMTQNNIMFDTLVSQLNTKMGIMRFVVTEGRE